MAKRTISLDDIPDDGPIETVQSVPEPSPAPAKPAASVVSKPQASKTATETKASKFVSETWARIHKATAPWADAVRAGFEKKSATEKQVNSLGFTGYNAAVRVENLEKQIGSAKDADELNRLVGEFVRLNGIPDVAIRAARRLIAQDFHALCKALTPALDAAIVESKAALADAGQLESKIFGEYGLPTAPTQFTETCQRIVAQIEGMKQMLQSKTERLLSSCDHPANLDYGQFKRIFE